jgi:hypothetical protein
VAGAQAREPFRAESSLCRRGRLALRAFPLRPYRRIGQQLVDRCLVDPLARVIHLFTGRFARVIININAFGSLAINAFGSLTEVFGYLTGELDWLIHARD